MRYALIEDYNIDNGEGVRAVLWTQGCPHRCTDCHNSHTWNENGGKEFKEEDKEYLFECIDKYFEKNLSVLGGEPLAPYNIDGLTSLLKEVKEKKPNINIWLWTGYLWEEVNQLEIIKYIDVLIDGKFIKELKVDKLKYRGSTNQRVINVKESLLNEEIEIILD